MSNQNRQWRPIPAGDWEIAALQETVMAFERSQDGTLVTQYLTAIACLEEIARRALPAESDGWRRLEHLREGCRVSYLDDTGEGVILEAGGKSV